MAKTVVILQSNYIPWRGYFDLIRWSDLFILYDNVQYTKNDWRNRNRIKTAKGPLWLSIPVLHRGHFGENIAEARVANGAWAKRHWRSIAQSYARAPAFEYAAATLAALYEEAGELEGLSEINGRFLRAICGLLGITTPLVPSSGYAVEGGPSERLAEMCRLAGATSYLTGPAARSYLDEGLFASAGIEVKYADYSGLAPYPQLFGQFHPQMSIIDLLLNAGPDAPRYLSPEPRYLSCESSAAAAAAPR